MTDPWRADEPARAAGPWRADEPRGPDGRSRAAGARPAYETVRLSDGPVACGPGGSTTRRSWRPPASTPRSPSSA